MMSFIEGCLPNHISFGDFLVCVCFLQNKGGGSGLSLLPFLRSAQDTSETSAWVRPAAPGRNGDSGFSPTDCLKAWLLSHRF